MSTISVTDHLNRTLQVPQNPQRIISLVPSITELLVDLGLSDRIVGVTGFCVHPEGIMDDKKVVGGTKKIISKRLNSLNPDLIIANLEENTPEMVEACEKKAPTYVTRVCDLTSALTLIRDIGSITNTGEIAGPLIENIQDKFDQLSQQMTGERWSVAYLIWRKPYMTVGGDTFISDMLHHAGYRNIFKDRQRYPMVELSEVISRNPDLLFLSSEPYHFKEKDRSSLADDLKSIKVKLVDGEMFSWYGSRMVKSAGYFAELVRGLG